MILADYIAIGLVAVFGAIGAIIGFGKGLKVFSKGIVGVCISAVVTYFLLGVVMDFGFVQTLLGRFVEYLNSTGNAVAKFFVIIRIDVIALAVVLFAIVQIIRILIVKLIEKIAESDNVAVKVINRIGGALFAVVVMAGLALIAMQIVKWANVGGEEFFEGSFFKLDVVFANNPLNSLVRL